MSRVPPDVVVRELTAADLPRLEVLERDLFGPAAWSPASLAAELVTEGRWYVGAAVPATGLLVGYAGLWFDGDDAQVMTIAVDSQHQDRGIARTMLDRLVDHARGLGADRVLLEVRVDNDPAIHLYESTGFRRLGRRRAYYQPGNVDAWTMLLPLRVAAPAGPEPR